MKITDVRVLLLSGPIPPERRWTSDLGTATKIDGAIVFVETDEGITGFGEARGTPAVMKTIVEEQLRPLLLGQDPTRITWLWERMYSGVRLGLALRHGRPYHATGSRGETIRAISGVDVALWDITGKALGVPVYQLLGGRVRERVRCYASGGWAPVGKAGEELASYVAQGFTAVKMRVGGMDDEDFPRRSVQRVREVRQAIGPTVELMVDAHGALNLPMAMRLSRALEEYDITWFEEPVAVGDDLRGLAELRARTSIPVATGENETTRFAFRDIIEARAVDYLQPDIAIVGGLTEACRVAALAHAHGLPVVPHIWGTALMWAASLQFAAAMPNCPLLEFCMGYNPLFTDLLTSPVQVGPEGHVTVPTGPGLGVELQPDLERKYPLLAGHHYAEARR